MSVICQYVKFIAYHQEIGGSKTWWSFDVRAELVVWIFVDSCGFLWIFVDFCGFLWIFVDFSRFLWIFVDFC